MLPFARFSPEREPIEINRSGVGGYPGALAQIAVRDQYDPSRRLAETDSGLAQNSKTLTVRFCYRHL